MFMLKDHRDNDFFLEGGVEAIAFFLNYGNCTDIFDVVERLKADNNGEAGYYVEGFMD